MKKIGFQWDSIHSFLTKLFRWKSCKKSQNIVKNHVISWRITNSCQKSQNCVKKKSWYFLKNHQFPSKVPSSDEVNLLGFSRWCSFPIPWRKQILSDCRTWSMGLEHCYRRWMMSRQQWDLVHTFAAGSTWTYPEGRHPFIQVLPPPNKNAYMHEQTTTGFGVVIWGRKYLNECTLSGYVSLCYIEAKCSIETPFQWTIPGGWVLKWKRYTAIHKRPPFLHICIATAFRPVDCLPILFGGNHPPQVTDQDTL